MELGLILILRVLFLAGAIRMLSVVLRRKGSPVEKMSTTPHGRAADAVIVVALTLVPVWQPSLFGSAQSSLLGVWALLQLSLFVGGLESGAKSYLQKGVWTLAWGISLAVGTTLFASTDLEALTSQQDRLMGGLLPAWGVFFQPAALLAALLSQAGMNQSGRATPLVNGLMVVCTVSVFLGGCHVPWLSDEALLRAFGEAKWAVLLLQVLVTTGKMALVWAIVDKLIDTKPLTNHRWFEPHRLAVVACANLVITWALIAGVTP